MANKQLFFLLNQARHSSMKYVDQNCKAMFGVSGVQIGALFYLKQNPNSLLKTMSEALFLDDSAITGLVKRLERIELVSRERCASDGRAFRLSLTSKGLDTIEQVIPYLKEFNRSIESQFSDEELDIVAKYLKTMRGLSNK